MKTSASSVVIGTQRSNITIFPQLHENETHHIFVSVTPIKKFPTRSNGSSMSTGTAASLSAGNTTPATTLPEPSAIKDNHTYNISYYLFF